MNRERPLGSGRRFVSPKIDPANTKGLNANHPALSEGRSIFPASVVLPSESPRLLVSGVNNSKLGRMVTKGPRAGWPIFQLTLEERATCPRSCAQWSNCYGNAMHLARRHRVVKGFLPKLEAELEALNRAYPKGFLVRLHTLGDFYSADYVQFWADMLDELPALHVFGYTARSEHKDDAQSRRTAKALIWLVEEAFDRFAIRFSRASPVSHGAVVVDEPSTDPRVIMCPAQTGATEACATCGLCWSEAARDKTIGFLRHGMRRQTGPRKGKSGPLDISPESPGVL